jgi:hypothetical protein
MNHYIFCDAEDLVMRTTVTVDGALYEQALELADPGMNKSDIFREAMKTLVRVQTAKRLAALGGSMSGQLLAALKSPREAGIFNLLHRYA